MSEKQSFTLSKLPVFFELSGKPVLAAGDEKAVMLKAKLLAMAGARVTICAPDMRADFEDLLARLKPAHKIAYHERKWCRKDLQKIVMAIGAFTDLQSATEFSQATGKLGIPVNMVDRPGLCDFQIPVIVNRSPLVIGISTGGAAPVIGQWLRGRLESLLPIRTGAVLEAAAACRSKVNAKLKNPAARRNFWRTIAEQNLGRLARNKNPVEIETALLACLEKSDGEAFDKGQVLLICVPDLPEEMSLKTLSWLQNADVIVRFGDVNPDYLDFVRRDASQIEPVSNASNLQEIISRIEPGQNVIWLHGKATKSDRADTARTLSVAGIECQIL